MASIAFSRSQQKGNRQYMILQAFTPIERQLNGILTLYEHRSEPDVDICPQTHLLCVNFQTQHNATYSYAGAKDWHGTRHMGMAHLIEPEHRIIGFVPEGTDHVVLRIDHTWLADLAMKTFNVDAFNLFSDGIPYRDERLRQLCTLIRDELVGDNEPLMLDALSVAVGIHLLRTTSTLSKLTLNRRSALPPRKLRLIKEYIEQNLANGITLADLATLVELSPDHFWHCFRDETGLTPHEYLTRTRIELVMSKLCNPSTTLAEASFAAGFSSQSHMTRVFRKHMGITPGKWRRECT